jgi:hypothetical protein
LATVFGVSASNNRAVNVPSLVVKCANNIDMLSVSPLPVALWPKIE